LFPCVFFFPFSLKFTPPDCRLSNDSIPSEGLLHFLVLLPFSPSIFLCVPPPPFCLSPPVENSEKKMALFPETFFFFLFFSTNFRPFFPPFPPVAWFFPSMDGGGQAPAFRGCFFTPCFCPGSTRASPAITLSFHPWTGELFPGGGSSRQLGARLFSFKTLAFPFSFPPPTEVLPLYRPSSENFSFPLFLQVVVGEFRSYLLPLLPLFFFRFFIKFLYLRPSGPQSYFKVSPVRGRLAHFSFFSHEDPPNTPFLPFLPPLCALFLIRHRPGGHASLGVVWISFVFVLRFPPLPPRPFFLTGCYPFGLHRNRPFLSFLFVDPASQVFCEFERHETSLAFPPPSFPLFSFFSLFWNFLDCKALGRGQDDPPPPFFSHRVRSFIFPLVLPLNFSEFFSRGSLFSCTSRVMTDH